jgi:hypothetical protein
VIKVAGGLVQLTSCPFEMDFSEERFALACLGEPEFLGMHGLNWLGESKELLDETVALIRQEEARLARAAGQG